jgi:hypothetical protein
MKGSRIIVTSRPRGVFEEVVITGTPKPGTVMEIKPATEPVGNVFNYQAYGTQAASGGKFVTNDGDRKAIAILLENDQEGKTYDDAYAANDRGKVYYPAPGETFNMIFQVQSGTGDTFAIGDEMMVDDGTGKLIAADSDAEAHPFTCLETEDTALAADELKWVRFNGAGGA